MTRSSPPHLTPADLTSTPATPEDIDRIVTRKLAEDPAAHAAVLESLFELAQARLGQIDYERVTTLASLCIEMARRRDRCQREDNPDFAMVKLLTSDWGIHTEVHDALARVIAAYVEHKVIDLDKPMSAPFQVRMMLCSPVPILYAVLRGKIQIAEQLVLHGCKFDGALAGAPEGKVYTSLLEFVEAKFASVGPFAPKADVSVASALARLSSAAMHHEIGIQSTAGPGPVHGSEATPAAPHKILRARMGL